MAKMDKSYVRSLCRDLATEPSPTKRANAATTLKNVLSEEEKESTPADSAILRVAGEIFQFREELPRQERVLTTNLTSSRTSPIAISVVSRAHFAD